jgi:hypothetical protein
MYHQQGNRVKSYILCFFLRRASPTHHSDRNAGSDHKTFFMDLDVDSYFGYKMDAIPAKQLRQLQLDDLRIANEYRQQLHTPFMNHNVYRRIRKNIGRTKSEEWSILDEEEYEKIDQDITRSMLSGAKKCGSRSKKRSPWSPVLGMATQAIRSWDVRIKRQCNCDSFDLVLNFYLIESDVDKEAHDRTLSYKNASINLTFLDKNLRMGWPTQRSIEANMRQSVKEEPIIQRGGIFDLVEM